jgi:GTP-binding protein
MLIDDVTIKVTAGRGGDGLVAFNKTKMSLGPTGGNGGNGGSVYVEGVSDLNALIQFRYRKELAAKDGETGKNKLNDGADMEDLILKVPVGTVVHNLSTGNNFEIISIGQRVLIAKGGHGGNGNFLFRSSTNTSPKQFEEGLPGEEYRFRLELKLIADIGLIGLPNVGKSSLLNKLTNAKSKVANYPFTTLDPSLGVYYELILADIPGLIEGASGGKGLGIKFLRHVERTRMLFHLISAQSPDPVKDYEIVRKELEAYNKELLEKPEYIFLTKVDLLEKEEIEEKVSGFNKTGKKIIPMSIENNTGISQIEEVLRMIIKDKHE